MQNLAGWNLRFLRAVGPPFLPVAVALVVTALVGDRQAALPYYAAIAQTLPVLVLVLALEQRYFFRRTTIPPAPSGIFSSPPFSWVIAQYKVLTWVYPLLLLVFLTTAEGLALDALASQSPGDAYFAFTAGALAGSFAAVALLASGIVTGSPEAPSD